MMPLISSRIPLAQRGMATLTTALILLIAITLMTFSSARVGIVEHQIAANDYRAKQALHAAQAGLDRAVYQSNVSGVGTVNGVPTAVTTLAAVGTGPSTSYQYAFSSVLTDNDGDGGADTSDTDDDGDGIADGSDTENSFPLVRVTATGFSDDSVATKTLTQYIKLYSPLPKVPDNPLSTGDKYDSNSNSISIVNNVTSPNGIAIQAQREVDTGGSDNNPKVITSAKVGGVLTAGAGLSRDGAIPIAGVTGKVEGTAESDAFFYNAFGTTKADIQSISKPVTCNGPSDCNAKLGNVGGSPIAPFIWVSSETKLNSGTVIGSASKPVVLVVDGKLDLSGGVIIYGFIYVMGDVDGDGTNANGGTTLNGSLVSEKEVKFGGTVTVNYNRFDTGPPGPGGPDFYVKAPGTWKDF